MLSGLLKGFLISKIHNIANCSFSFLDRSGDQTLQDMFKIDDGKIIGQQEHQRRYVCFLLLSFVDFKVKIKKYIYNAVPRKILIS